MRHKTAVSILTIIVVVIGYWWYIALQQQLSISENMLRIHFMDVGQGDAVLVETPKGYQVLIDAGRGIQILNALDTILQANDRDIDIAIMTHPDEDHIGGFMSVLQRYSVKTVIQSFIASESNMYKQITSAIEREGATTHTIKQAYSFSLDNVQFDILWPIGMEVTETNAASIVLLMTYGTTKILLTGDAPAEVEEFLIKSFPKKLSDIEILKTGHHGSKTSTAASFLMHTKPNTIVHSFGENNPYKHPHEETIKRIKTFAQKNPTEKLTEHYTRDGTISLCVTPSRYTHCR